MKLLVEEAIQDYVMQMTQEEPDYLQSLIQQTYEQMSLPQMLTGRIEGRLLKLLVLTLQPRLIFEIGMFTGYSALSMAEGLKPDGRIITCEIDPKAQAIAQQAFNDSPYAQQIEIRMGPALKTLQTLNDTIDMAFIDADKEHYPQYYEGVMEKLNPGGLIIIDNALWSGEVLNPQDEASKAVARLNEMIAHDSRVENAFLTVRDGIQIVRKNNDQ